MDEQTTPRDARELAEHLAERLNAHIGVVRLELQFKEGRLLTAYRHEKFGARQLEVVPIRTDR